MKRILLETDKPSVFKPIKMGLVENTKSGSKDFIVEGIFGKIDSVNENNRLYPREEFERNLKEGSIFRNKLKRRAVLGELEHPESGNTHLARVSHLITDVWIDQLDESKITKLGYDTASVSPGTYVLGKMEIFNTPNGKILQELFERRVDVGVSSRGRGETKSESGFEKVYDYDLETWDAVYLPSVTEARPKRIGEADELGSMEGIDKPESPPDAPVGGMEPMDATVEPPTKAGPPDDWKETAEALVRSLESVASESKPELKAMIELQSRGIGVIDTLASMQEPDSIKLKAQVIALLQVLINRILAIEVGEDVAGEPVTNSGSETKKKKKKEDESLIKEKIENPDVVAKDIKAKRQASNKAGDPLYKGDVEAILKQGGHEVNDENIGQLVSALTKEGMTVHSDKYESLTEALVDIDTLVDGTTVMVPVSALKDNYLSEEPFVKKWLTNQKSEVPAVLISRGYGGVVLRMVDPAVQGHEWYFAYQDQTPEKKLGKVKTESKIDIGEDTMKSAELIKKLTEEAKKLAEENKKLKEATETTVPVERYNASKKLISGLIDRVKLAEKKLAVSVKMLKEQKEESQEEDIKEEKRKKEPEIKKEEIEEMDKALKTSKETNPRRKELTEDSISLRKRLAEAGKTDPLVEAIRPVPNVMSVVAKKFAK